MSKLREALEKWVRSNSNYDDDTWDVWWLNQSRSMKFTIDEIEQALNQSEPTPNNREEERENMKAHLIKLTNGRAKVVIAENALEALEKCDKQFPLLGNHYIDPIDIVF